MRYQPQGLRRIDRRNPLVRGLTGAIIPGMVGAVKVGGAGFQTTRDGIGFSTFSTSDQWVVSPTALASSSPTWTMLAIFAGNVGTNGAAGVTFYAERPNGTQIAKLELNTTSGTVSMVVRDLSGNLANPAGTTDIRTDNGAMRVVVGTRRASNQHLVFFNGKQEGSNGTNVSGSFGATNGVVGADPQDSSGYLAGASVPLVLVWNRALSDSEIAGISRNPWQIFEAADEDDLVAKSAAAYILSAAAGTFGVSGQAATLKAARRLIGGVGTLAALGSSASLLVGHRLAAASGGLALTLMSAALRIARKLYIAPNAVAVTGTGVAIKAARLLSATTGVAALAGAAASLVSARRLSAQTAAIALDAGSATFTYTPKPGGLGPTYTLSGGTGVLLLSATAARLVLTRRLMTVAGAFSTAGVAATLRTARGFPAATGALTVAGAPTGLRAARRLPASLASFSLASGTATFLYIPITRPGGPTYTLNVVGGALGLTGTGVPLRARRRLLTGAAQFAVTGWAANLANGQKIVYARAPAGSGYTPRTDESQHRPGSAATARPGATQRNNR